MPRPRHALNAERLAGGRINRDQRTIHTHGTAANTKSRGHHGVEAFEHRLDLATDHAVHWAAHAGVALKGGAFRQHAFIGGGHMRVRADDGGDFAVEMQPMATFSLVASAWKSTKITGVSWRSSSTQAAMAGNGLSSVWFMKVRPCRFTTATLHFLDSKTMQPLPGVPAG